MNLYLVQHAEAVSEEVDPDRPLSQRGTEEIRRVAGFAAKAGVRMEAIHHSGKTRAQQTAEALAAALHPAGGLAQSDGLKPLDEPGIWAERVSQLAADTMLVGHLPHLSRLAGLLLTGDQEASPVSFQMGGIVCLTRGEAGAWSLKWMVTPEQLR